MTRVVSVCVLEYCPTSTFFDITNNIIVMSQFIAGTCLQNIAEQAHASKLSPVAVSV